MWSTFNLSNIFLQLYFCQAFWGQNVLIVTNNIIPHFDNHIKFGVLFKAKDLIFFSGILIIGKLYLDKFCGICP